MKNRGGIEVKKFHGFGEQLSDFVNVSFEMVAMRGGASVTGNAQGPFDVEMRIERGQVTDGFRNVVDQPENGFLLLPAIAEQIRQQPRLGGKLGAQGLAREEDVNQHEPVGGPVRQWHRQEACQRTPRFPVRFARPGRPKSCALGDRRAELCDRRVHAAGWKIWR